MTTFGWAVLLIIMSPLWVPAILGLLWVLFVVVSMAVLAVVDAMCDAIHREPR